MAKKEVEQPVGPPVSGQDVLDVIEQNRGQEASTKAKVSSKEEGAAPKKESTREENIETVMGETEDKETQAQKPAKEEAETKGSVPGLAPNPEDVKQSEDPDASKISGAVETQEGFSEATLNRPEE